MDAPILEQNHEATKTTEVPPLRGAVHGGPAESVASEVLLEAGLREGEQGCEPVAVAAIAEGAQLFPGAFERAARAGVAGGSSGLLAQEA